MLLGHPSGGGSYVNASLRKWRRSMLTRNGQKTMSCCKSRAACVDCAQRPGTQLTGSHRLFAHCLVVAHCPAPSLSHVKKKKKKHMTLHRSYFGTWLFPTSRTPRLAPFRQPHPDEAMPIRARRALIELTLPAGRSAESWHDARRLGRWRRWELRLTLDVYAHFLCLRCCRKALELFQRHATCDYQSCVEAVGQHKVA